MPGSVATSTIIVLTARAAAAEPDVSDVLGVRVAVADMDGGFSVYVDVNVGRLSADHEPPLLLGLVPRLAGCCLPGCDTYVKEFKPMTFK